jgi:hypothetical protein
VILSRLCDNEVCPSGDYYIVTNALGVEKARREEQGKVPNGLTARGRLPVAADASLELFGVSVVNQEPYLVSRADNKVTGP